MIDNKFSIILPTYNRGDSYLKHAINSVIEQSYKNWELIIIDNNSTDSTDSLVKSYKNSKIKLYKISNDGNIAKSRNLGIKKSSGDYIAFLDSDDYWTSEKLHICNKYFMNNSNSGLCHAENWLDEIGVKTYRMYGKSNRFNSRFLIERGNCLSLSAVVLPKYFLDEVGLFSEDGKFITAEDYELWIRLAKAKCHINYISDMLGVFRVHTSSESQNVLRNTYAIIDVIKHHHDQAIYLEINNCISQAWLNSAKHCHIDGSYSLALSCYIKSLNYKFKMQFFFVFLLLIPNYIFKRVFRKYRN